MAKVQRSNMDMDALRRAAQSKEDFRGEIEAGPNVGNVDDGKLFGMTAMERMFLSIGLFGVTLVVSVLLLVASGSIGL